MTLTKVSFSASTYTGSLLPASESKCGPNKTSLAYLEQNSKSTKWSFDSDDRAVDRKMKNFPDSYSIDRFGISYPLILVFRSVCLTSCFITLKIEEAVWSIPTNQYPIPLNTLADDCDLVHQSSLVLRTIFTQEPDENGIFLWIAVRNAPLIKAQDIDGQTAYKNAVLRVGCRIFLCNGPHRYGDKIKLTIKMPWRI